MQSQRAGRAAPRTRAEPGPAAPRPDASAPAPASGSEAPGGFGSRPIPAPPAGKRGRRANRRLKDRSDAGVLAEIRRVADLIEDAALRRDAFDQVSLLTSDSIARRFGGWGAALAMAGLGHRYRGPVVTEGMRRKPARGLTERQLLARLRRIARRDGVVTQAMLARRTSMCAQTYAKRFGTWSTALRLAGLRLSNWQSMTAEARAARAEARSRANSASGPGGADPATRRYVPMHLRFAVLKRDDYRCRLCGDSPAINRGTTLEVDHIQPFSKGGRTTEDNLRTLCRRCNQGKGATT